MQPANVQAHLMKHFDELMVEVQTSLDASNRDKFSQNLNAFLQEVRKYIVYV